MSIPIPDNGYGVTKRLHTHQQIKLQLEDSSKEVRHIKPHYPFGAIMLLPRPKVSTTTHGPKNTRDVSAGGSKAVRQQRYASPFEGAQAKRGGGCSRQ